MVRTLLHWHSESPNVNSVALSVRGGVLLDPITIDEIVGIGSLLCTVHTTSDDPAAKFYFAYHCTTYLYYMYVAL